MKYVKLPKTDLTVSHIALGSAEFGVEATYPGMKAVPEKDAFRQMDRFTDMGGNLIDTAHCYADWIPGEFSRSEKCIGRWLSTRKNRDKICLATKGGIDFTCPRGPFGPPIDLSLKEINKDIDESLENLKTDYIDLYWLHRDEPSRPAGEIIETLASNVKRGTIRYYGCSNWTPRRIKEANDYAEKHGLMPFVGNQFEWSLARMFCPEAPLDDLPFMDEETYAFHKSTGMTAFAYSSQGNGFFTKLDILGKDNISDNLKKHFLNERTLAAYERIKVLSQKTGYTVTQIALSFINSQYEFTGIPIIFSRTHEQFEDSLSASDTTLTPDMVDFLLTE